MHTFPLGISGLPSHGRGARVPGCLGYFIPVKYLGTYPESRFEGIRPAAEPKKNIHNMSDHFVFSTMCVHGETCFICCRAILDTGLATRLHDLN